MYRTEADARILPSASDPAGIPFDGIAPDLLMKMRAGAHVLTVEWEEMFCEGRLRTRAKAVARRTSAVGATFSHTTAAAQHRLPVYRVHSDRVEMIIPGENSRRDAPDIVRHHQVLPAGDVVEIDGLQVTSLDRTIYDVIRTASLATAITCFDAALRQMAWDDDEHAYDFVAAAQFRQLVVDRIVQHSGARGIRQARFVADFADGRAQLPGESVSRLWMYQLGLPAPELQYRVEFGGGTFALLDFAWPTLGRWAEFDGDVKYTNPEVLAGRTGDQVRDAQNEREMKVRRLTGWHVDRWGFERMPSLDVFATFLRSVGLYPAASLLPR